MTRCAYTSSGCNAPQSECMGLCLHRVDTSALCHGDIEQRMPIEFAEPEPTRIGAAWDAYKAHRQHGRIDGIRHAWQTFWREA